MNFQLPRHYERRPPIGKPQAVMVKHY